MMMLALWGAKKYKNRRSTFIGAFFGLVAASVTEKPRMKRVRRLAKSEALRFLETGSLMKLNEHLPLWLKYPDADRLTWLNKLVLGMWPMIDQYFDATVRESIELALADGVTMPSMVQSIQVKNMSLGKTPALVTGIRVYEPETDADHLTMEFGVSFVADMHQCFKLLVELTGGAFKIPMPVLIKDFQFIGVFRMDLIPLVPISPFAGAARVSLIEKPVIDFSFEFLALQNVPGLETAMNKMIRESIATELLWPNSVVTPLLVGFETEQLLGEGRLIIRIINVKDLPSMDWWGESDPFVLMQLEDEETMHPVDPVLGEVVTTRYKSVPPKTNNPNERGKKYCSTRAIDDGGKHAVWEETFEIVVNNSKEEVLQLMVFDEDKWPNTSDIIGWVAVKLSELPAGKNVFFDSVELFEQTHTPPKVQLGDVVDVLMKDQTLADLVKSGKKVESFVQAGKLRTKGPASTPVKEPPSASKLPGTSKKSDGVKGNRFQNGVLKQGTNAWTAAKARIGVDPKAKKPGMCGGTLSFELRWEPFDMDKMVATTASAAATPSKLPKPATPTKAVTPQISRTPTRPASPKPATSINRALDFAEGTPTPAR